MPFAHEIITLDMALSKSERELGLSHRKNLLHNEGMLFYLDEASQVSFHSKKITFDICIVFLDENKRILYSQILPPNRHISSPLKSHYALELSAVHCTEMKKIEYLPLCDRD
tara:strand:+ start:380 stop:715 length:336 start_codon:yes stop_codon:yes gene_type:complete